MKRTYCTCDICKQKATQEGIDVCHGYELTLEDSSGTKKFKPFEQPTIRKTDLCDKHYKMWCKATYECFWGKTK